MVRSIRFALGALGDSLAGWMQWINNPDIASKFRREELEEMNRTITDFVKSFIEYDIKVTNEGIRKGLSKKAEWRPSKEPFLM